MVNERGSDGDPLAEDLREETWAGRAVADEPSTTDVSVGDGVADDFPGEDDEALAASEAPDADRPAADPPAADRPDADRIGPFGDRTPPPPPPSAGWSSGRPRRSGAAAGAAAAAPASPSGAPAGGSSFEDAAPGGEVSFGTWLRRQREMREIDLREIADKTKISLRYLKAMEQGRFEILPAPIFARGFLKEYSKYVGLNADEVVNYYLAAHEGRGLEAEADEAFVDPGRSKSPVTRGALMVLLLIVAIAAIAYFVFYRRSQEEAERAAPPPIAAPVNEAVVAQAPPPPPPEPVLTAPLVVTLDLVQECWIEAHVDGVPQVSRLFVAGESLQLEAEESVQLTLGNGGGVDVQVNNMPFGVDAESGETIHLTIDLATVERLRQRSG